MDDQNQQKPDGQIVDVAPAPPAEEEPQANTMVPTVSADESAPTETTNSTTDMPATDAPSDPAQDGRLPAPGMPTGQKAGGPILAIVAAIAVAVGLAAITVYAYMKTQKSEEPAATQTVNNTSDQTSTTEEIDQTSKEVDEAINAADEADFDESELSDQSLGL